MPKTKQQLLDRLRYHCDDIIRRKVHQSIKDEHQFILDVLDDREKLLKELTVFYGVTFVKSYTSDCILATDTKGILEKATGQKIEDLLK